MAMKTKAVFLDKDGTLIENHPFDRAPEHIAWIPGVTEGLQLLHRWGYALIVVTNQGGIAQGRFTIEEVLHEQAALRADLAECEVPLAGFYFCPHDPNGNVPSFTMNCFCRKPNPGLVMQAAEKLNVDLTRSWMIGDILHDVEAGRTAGCRTILLTNGNETEWNLTPSRWPEFFAADVFEAAQLITLTDLTASGEQSCPLDEESWDR